MTAPFYPATGSPASTVTNDSGVVPNNYPDAGNTLDNTVIGSINPAAATFSALTLTGLFTRTGGSVVTPVTVTAATLTLSAAIHGGRTVVQDSASGCTFTLPAATGTGVIFRIEVATTITSVGAIINTAGTDVFAGSIIVAKNSDGTSYAGGSTANKTITLNGTTTGGIAGSYVEVEDIKAGKWQVRGIAPASGTIATPFSN